MPGAHWERCFSCAGRALGALLFVCLAHGHDGIPVREATPAASSGCRALGPRSRDALCVPLRLRGGERVKEGQVGKKGGKSRGDGKKREKRRRQGVSTDDGDADTAPAAEESQQAVEAGSGGGRGAAEGLEGVGEARGAAGADALSPKMFYGGNFTEDFPNRARVDALYREAEVFVQKREQSSSELEESSGDGQGNNPFEVCATLWCAGPRL